jgi:alkyl hydroperoxide reductase subunit AhpC
MKFITKIISFAVLALTQNFNAVDAFPMPRTMAPAFEGLNAVDANMEFTKLSLSDFKDKYVVLVFYPFDFTYVCPTELISFSENVSRFKELGAEVIGISTDSHFTHLAWLKQNRADGGLGKIEYPLIADISKQMSEDYGVLVTEEGDPMRGAAIRGMFILDKEHKIRSVQINDDAVGRNVEEVLRLIQGFQFADKNGEVCPANW